MGNAGLKVRSRSEARAVRASGRQANQKRGVLEGGKAKTARYCFFAKVRLNREERNAFHDEKRQTPCTGSSGMRQGAGIGRLWTFGRVRQTAAGANGLAVYRRGDEEMDVSIASYYAGTSCVNKNWCEHTR